MTVRISRPLRDQLTELKGKHGLSLGDVLRNGLEKAKPDLEDSYRQGYLDVLGQCLGIVEGCRRCWEPMCKLIPDDA